MPVVVHSKVAPEPFKGGATYQTLVGDEKGSTPIRVGIQTSPPGYRTPLHSHPYLETITVLEGQGEAWLQGREELVKLEPGVTLVLEPQPAPLVPRHRRCAAQDVWRACLAEADRRGPRRRARDAEPVASFRRRPEPSTPS